MLFYIPPYDLLEMEVKDGLLGMFALAYSKAAVHPTLNSDQHCLFTVLFHYMDGTPEFTKPRRF